MVKRKCSDLDDSKVPEGRNCQSRTIETCTGKLWYRRHLGEFFQLQFVGPLPWESVKKIAHSPLRYDCNIDDLVDGSFVDPFKRSLTSIYSNSRTRPIRSEVEMQQHIFEIISSQLKILERLILRHYFKGKIELVGEGPQSKQEDEIPLFTAEVNLNTDSTNMNHPTSLRTMTMTGSTPCPDILVSISAPCYIINENKTWMLNQTLRSRKHAILSVFEIKRQIGHNIKPVGIQPYFWHTCAGDLTNESSTRSAKKRRTRSGSSGAEEKVKAKHQADLSGFYSPISLIDEHNPTVDFLLQELEIPNVDISQADRQPKVDREELTQVSNTFKIHLMSDSTYTSCGPKWCVRAPSSDS
jgi:hypothetical protein